MLNRKTIQQNLAAVLAEVNLVQPQNSLLLSKAVSVHGSQEQAPIKNRQAAAYRELEYWVWATLADNPQLHDEAAKSCTVPSRLTVSYSPASPPRRPSPRSRRRRATSRGFPWKKMPRQPDGQGSAAPPIRIARMTFNQPIPRLVFKSAPKPKP